MDVPSFPPHTLLSILTQTKDFITRAHSLLLSPEPLHIGMMHANFHLHNNFYNNGHVTVFPQACAFTFVASASCRLLLFSSSMCVYLRSQ